MSFLPLYIHQQISFWCVCIKFSTYTSLVRAQLAHSLLFTRKFLFTCQKVWAPASEFIAHNTEEKSAMEIFKVKIVIKILVIFHHIHIHRERHTHTPQHHQITLHALFVDFPSRGAHTHHTGNDIWRCARTPLRPFCHLSRFTACTWPAQGTPTELCTARAARTDTWSVVVSCYRSAATQCAVSLLQLGSIGTSGCVEILAKRLDSKFSFSEGNFCKFSWVFS